MTVLLVSNDLPWLIHITDIGPFFKTRPSMDRPLRRGCTLSGIFGFECGRFRLSRECTGW